MVLSALLCTVSHVLFLVSDISANHGIVIQAALGQDFAYHGTYTEPTTGIKFYTSYAMDGTVEGDGIFSMVSKGGYLFGIALPERATTVDVFDYIGIVVSQFLKRFLNPN